MVDRISALAGHHSPGHFGATGEPGVTLQEISNLVLHQVAAWPDTINAVGATIASRVGADSAPGPCQANEGSDGALLRIFVDGQLVQDRRELSDTVAETSELLIMQALSGG